LIHVENHMIAFLHITNCQMHVIQTTLTNEPRKVNVADCWSATKNFGI